jgi:8-oxo-dGTP diphosphatase
MSDDKTEYPKPSLTADVVVIALAPDAPRPSLRVLFIQRAHDPFAGSWALPGGFVEPTESASEGAARELLEETGLDRVTVEEVGCFSRPGRDPRGWVVSIAHLAAVPADRVADAKAGDDAAAAAWLDLEIAKGGAFTLRHEGAEVTALAFDHREIVAAAVRRAIDRVDTIALALLGETFTLAEAARAYAAILAVGVNEEVLGDRLLDEGMVREASPGRFAVAQAKQA